MKRLFQTNISLSIKYMELKLVPVFPLWRISTDFIKEPNTWSVPKLGANVVEISENFLPWIQTFIPIE